MKVAVPAYLILFAVALLYGIILPAISLCVVTLARVQMEGEGFVADLSPRSLPFLAETGEPIRFSVEVKNTGGRAWACRGRTALGLFDQRPMDMLLCLEGHGNNPLTGDQRRFAPTKEVPPGGTFEAKVEFSAPTKPGVYHLRLQMVDESVHGRGRWFGPAVEFDLTVTSAAGSPPRRSSFKHRISEAKILNIHKN